MAKKEWVWGFPDGKPHIGKPSKFTTQTKDGFQINVTLQENVDGVLVCSGLDIEFIKKDLSAPINPINSRYFQLLKLGEILSSARQAYSEWEEIISDAHIGMDAERELSEWTAQGPEGFPDSKYAALAYVYVQFVRQGLESPISAIVEKFGPQWDRNTWSGRIVEVRNRGLLTKPKVGKYGGRLTLKAEKLLGINQPKQKEENA